MKPRLGQMPWMVLSVLALWATHAPDTSAQLIPSDETRIRWRQGENLSVYRRNPGPPPVTVAAKDATESEQFLSLDEAIRLALRHSEVIRVLTGVSATSSGQTIYDTAIAVTPIDVEKARFDPVFRANSLFRRDDFPGLNSTGTGIAGSTTAGNDSGIGFSDRNIHGGVADISVDNRWDSQNGAGFLSRNVPSLDMGYTQPILAGFGRRANQAPIVIARLRQEQSYFQFKDGMQELVRGTINGYWTLVQARTDLWAREKQVEQLQFFFDLQSGRARAEMVSYAADAAQAKASLYNAKSVLLQSQGNVLQREAALRNLLGLPPEDGVRLVPSTPPTRDRIEFRWDEIIDTAQSHRPDLIELNLVLMADQQGLIQRKNLAQPSLDAVAQHRWNGLSGRLANTGANANAPFNDHTGWTMGVTFEVPLGLRASRAQLRSQELVIARDRANIQQSIHQVEHTLATVLRNVELNLAQYEAFRETRAASEANRDAQDARAEFNIDTQLNFLLAVSDVANATSSEALSLTNYNIELANLERQTGTILETHGIRFTEEQFASIGPCGKCFEDACYPKDLRSGDNEPRYEDTLQPAEEAFDLKDFVPLKRSTP